MKIVRMVAMVGVLSVAVASLAAAAGGAAVSRHSGAVEAIDAGRGTLVLAEVGPWTVKSDRTVITTRTIALTAATVYRRASRGDAAPSGFPGDFVLRPVTVRDIAAGDLVTAECERRDGTLVARTVTLVAIEP
jgi:hypothetical protein